MLNQNLDVRLVRTFSALSQVDAPGARLAGRVTLVWVELVLVNRSAMALVSSAWRDRP